MHATSVRREPSSRVSRRSAPNARRKAERSMRSRKLTLALASALATMAIGLGAQAASAAFPDFSGCRATNYATEACVDIQNRSGNLNIKGFNVPLGESLEIRGTLREEAGGAPLFVPPTGTTGFFARTVPVPGGIFGI